MPRRKIESFSSADASVTDREPDRSVCSGPAALGGRIRFFREERGIGQKVLAEKLGVSSNAVNNWEHGRGRPDLNLLPALCAALRISLADLFGIREASSSYSAGEQLLIGKYRRLSRGHQLAVSRMADTLLEIQAAESLPPLRRLVCYGKALAAGPGDPTEFEDEGTPLWVRANRQTEKADCVFFVNGDSMEPAYHHGDRVLVSRLPDASALKPGEIGAFIIGNETYIKVCGKDGLHSLNPAFPTIEFPEDTPVCLIGRVIGRLDPSQIASEADVQQYAALQA